MKYLAGWLLVCVCCLKLSAQTGEEQKWRVDVFAGVDLNYRNIHYNNRLYDLLINLTPGVKLQMKDHWQIALQGIVPVINDYGERYKKVRLNMAVLSKEMVWGRQFVKLSAGLFGQERYGLDMKWMFPINRWLALDGQLGYTGYCSMAKDWECSRIGRLTGTLGTRMFLENCNTEFRLRGGRFLLEDYGVIGECMRHFRHCTVGVYAQYSDKGKENGGFKVVMMIPPYKRKARKVNVRPASNFRLTYNIQGDPYSMRTYNTDPEENEREGWFEWEKRRWEGPHPQPLSQGEGGGAD